MKWELQPSTGWGIVRAPAVAEGEGRIADHGNWQIEFPFAMKRPWRKWSGPTPPTSSPASTVQASPNATYSLPWPSSPQTVRSTGGTSNLILGRPMLCQCPGCLHSLNALLVRFASSCRTWIQRRSRCLESRRDEPDCASALA